MLRRLFFSTFNFIVPTTCSVCGHLISTSQTHWSTPSLCPACFADLSFHLAPQCAQCATRLDTLFHHANLRCGACLADPPSFTKTWAPLIYAGTARHLVLALKHSGKRANAHILALHMRLFIAHMPTDSLIAPVPLHTSRLRTRGYNQSLDLALSLAQGTDLPVFRNMLIRTRATASLGTLNSRARRRNLLGAFAVRNPDTLKDKNVILVDDVMTSGATARALSKVVLRAGARCVYILAAARALPK